MRSKSFTVTGSAGGPTFSPVFIVDLYDSPCNIGIGVVVSGELTVAQVEHTFANPWQINLNASVSANAWEPNATLVSATQANGPVSTNYAFAPNAVRLKVFALGSAGTGNRATITINQAGPES